MPETCGPGAHDLDPTELCEDAIAYFTEGQCHTLAVVLAERGAGEVWLVWQDGEPAHAVVRRADGKFADAEGVWERGPLLWMWDAQVLMPWKCEGDMRAAVQQFYVERGDVVCDFAAAEIFAPLVEREWQMQLDEARSA